MQDFIFSQGIWLGEGKIAFSTSPEFLQFYMKLDISPQTDNLIKAIQTIQIQRIKEETINHFTFMEMTTENFNVMIENEIFGQVSGKGIIKEKMISWQFKGNPVFEGSETYKRLENGEFFLQAEYGMDQYRTLIEGVLWKKSL